MAALKATESTFKSFESELQQTKKHIDKHQDPEIKKRHQSTGLIDFNSAKKPVQKNSPHVGFSKTQRFKTPKAYDLDSSRGSITSVDSASTVDSNVSVSAIKTRSPLVLFGKSKRFEQPKTETNREFDLNPNYSVVKKREPSATIKTPIKYQLKAELAQKIVKNAKQASPQKGEHLNDESMETVRLENIERGTCNMSDVFSDTTEVMGPGAYNVDYRGVETRKSVGFTKSLRFKSDQKDEMTVLNPKYNQIHKAVPGVKIAAETEKNEKLLKKKTEEKVYQDLSNQLRNAAPIDKDAGIRKNVPQVFIKEEMENLSDKERLNRIWNLLNKRRFERRVAPGTYEPQDLDEPICTVVYRKSLSPKVLRLPERPPSPTRYYAKDDLIKTNQPAFSFNKEGIDTTPKLEDLDLRKALDINLNLVKPRAPGAIVLPEHPPEKLPELEDIKRGPGAYDASHKLTEKRVDLGVVKFPELNEHNMRENQVDGANKEAFDGELEPNYDVIKPRIPGFAYHEPVQLEGPAYPSEAELNPGEWKFYDVNLGAIKPEVGDVEFAGGLTRDQFAEREEEHKQFLDYQARQARGPEVGQYDIKYSGVEPEPKAPDFNKYTEREAFVEEYEDRDVPGDVLILNPEKPKPHVADIKFDRMGGREEETAPETEELILNPTHDLTKPKTVTYVDMSKQSERKDLYGTKSKENEDELILDVDYKQIDPKIKGIPDLSKLTSRGTMEAKPNEEIEELVVNPSLNLVKPNVSGTAVKMDSKTKRFDDKEKEDVNDGRWTTEQQIDYAKTQDAIKPKIDVVNFDRYAEREATEELEKKKNMKKHLKDLNSKIKKSDLPVIEEEKFERYPGQREEENKENKKANFLIRANKLVKKPSKTNVTEKTPDLRVSQDLEPWKDQQVQDIPDDD